MSGLRTLNLRLVYENDERCLVIITTNLNLATLYTLVTLLKNSPSLPIKQLSRYKQPEHRRPPSRKQPLILPDIPNSATLLPHSSLCFNPLNLHFYFFYRLLLHNTYPHKSQATHNLINPGLLNIGLHPSTLRFIPSSR